MRLFVTILFISWCGCLSVWAQVDPMGGIRATEQLAMDGDGSDAAILILDVEVASVTETAEIRETGYLQYDDAGPRIETKERKVLAKCRVLKVIKNKSSIEIKAGGNLTATFWRQIDGPISKNYREAWQNPPKVKEKWKFMFLEHDIEMKAKLTELRPTFVRTIQ